MTNKTRNVRIDKQIPEIATNPKFNAVTLSTIENIEAGRGLKQFKKPEELFAELEENLN